MPNAQELGHWPILVGFVFLILAAGFQWREGRVPNWLVLGAAGVALVLATAISLVGEGLAQGGIGSSLLGFVFGFGVLVVPYVRGWLGAGCVKSHAAFGAWVGCAVPAGGCWNIMAAASFVAIVATIAGVAFTFLRNKNQPVLFAAQITLSFGSILGAILCLAFVS